MKSKFQNYSKLSIDLTIWAVLIGVAILLAFSILTGNVFLAIPVVAVGALLIHPVYILFLIIVINPFADWIVVKYPSLFTKAIIDILIILFICVTMVKKIVMRKEWMVAPFHKFILVLAVFFVVSAAIYWTNFESFLFMNWIHFRFIYLAIAITQLSLNDKKYHELMKVFFIIYFLHLGIGIFQAAGGEWAKSYFSQEFQKVSLSYGLLQYSSYDTALHFNLGGATYIYSTFFSPGHFGGFLLIMLCLAFGMRMARNTPKPYKDQRSLYADKIPFPWIFLKRKPYVLLLGVIALLIVLTFSRSTYIGLIVLISFLILSSGMSWRKLVIYETALIALILLIGNVEVLVNYLRGVSNPEVGTFSPVERLLSGFSSYLLQDNPRKIAYWHILPKVVTEMPLMGLGVTSILNQQKFFSDSVLLSDALFYVYGDAGLVRLIVEYGVLGVLIFGLLFMTVFKHAREGYLFAQNYEERAVCFAVMTSIITLIPMSIGTMLILSKSYGLYLWVFIGLSQRWRPDTHG